MTFAQGVRTSWLNPRLDDYTERDQMPEVLVPCGLAGLPGVSDLKPNLVSSRLAFNDHHFSSSWHSPVLDVDFPIRVVESSTPGHHHLFLDGLMMKWDRYESLLAALADVGVIEQAYHDSSVRRRMTMVRAPGVRKPKGAQKWDRIWPEGVRLRETT